jgi:hypothetical protein
MKNYRKIRQEPYIYGFTMFGFIVFSATSVLCILSLLTGFTGVKCMVIMILIGLSFLICKNVLSNKDLIAKYFDNKLPKKYSKYE